MSGLFGTFNIVKRGMAAQQTALQVVAHNVANANTEGYSVQRANMKTTQPFGMPSLNTAAEPGQLGTGVQVSSITRSRDEYLDYQIRKENATLGKYESREQFLSQIESIFMEPSDTGISTVMGKFWDSWQQLSTTAEPNSTARTLVAQNGEALANAISHNYQQLSDMEVNAADITQQQIFEVSSILTQIQDINMQIKAVVVGGKEPNDLLDRRDLLLDKLSERFNFDIEKTDFGGIKIKAKINDSLDGDKTKSITLLSDSTQLRSISYLNKLEYSGGSWKAEICVNGNVNDKRTITLSEESVKSLADVDSTSHTINKIYTHAVFYNVNNVGTGLSNTFTNAKINGVTYASGSWQVEFSDDTGTNKTISFSDKEIQKYANVDLESHSVISFNKADIFSYNSGTGELTVLGGANFENGSLNGYNTITNEISDYKLQLNRLAKTIVIAVNTIHSNSTDSSSGVSFFDPSAETSSEAARDIKMNQAILDDPKIINAGKIIDKNDLNYSEGNGERALTIAQLRNIRMDISVKGSTINSRNDFLSDVYTNPNDSNNPITTLGNINLADATQAKLSGDSNGMTLDNYFKSTIATLGVSSQESSRMVTNQNALLSQLETRKESTSGVSIDEEMTNMIQFQRSYEANAKMISVVDQLLDVVVNGLIRR